MKRPAILNVDVKLVDNAVTLWRSGELVAFPTETVYGLGADATNGEAVAKIYEVKARPQFNPLIVHAAEAATLKRYVEWTPAAEKLAAKFWPGPLTLVMKRRVFCSLSELVSAGGNTLAIRVPSHPVARQLLTAFGGSIAAPSANRSGRVSPTTADHVREELGSAIKLLIDGGDCDVGVESTVIDLSGKAPVLLRPGAITREMIEAVLGEKLQNVSVEEDAEAPKSPGMMEAHYAPSIPVRPSANGVAANEALLAFGPAPLTGAAITLNLSETGNLIEAAANLFAYLRQLDKPEYRAIAVMPIPNTGLGEAINDRLRRASVTAQ